MIDKNTQVQYFKALLEGRMATASFMETLNPELAAIPSLSDIYEADVKAPGYWWGNEISGEIKEAK